MSALRADMAWVYSAQLPDEGYGVKEYTMMAPEVFWERAAAWGSFMSSGDPGACMYGFDERGVVQSEAHRQACIAHIDGQCREAAAVNEDPAADNAELDEMRAYLVSAKLAPS